MQELMKMNYGGGPYRGFGGAPQPQRANNRRNRGGGPQNFRQSRFEHNQQQQNKVPNQQNDRQAEVKVAAPEEPANKVAVQQSQPSAPIVETKSEPSKPVQQAPSSNQQPAQNQQHANGPAEKKPVMQSQNQGNMGHNQNQGNIGQNQNQGNIGQNQNQGNIGHDESNQSNFNNKRGGKFGGGGGPPRNQQQQQPQQRNQQQQPQQRNQQQQQPQQRNQQQQQQRNQQQPQQRNQSMQRNQQQQQRGPRQSGDKGHFQQGGREDHILASKLKELQGQLLDLPPLEQAESKFNGRSRLYVGNLSNDMTEEEILQMFSPFGETAELFHNKEKNFAFIKMDNRANAERAKRELDGTMRRGRPLRVRSAPNNCAVRVRNLTQFVSNELLYRSFEIFGKIERAYVRVDERGKSLNEGVVEFARKPSALACIRNCTEKCFFLSSSLRPVIVEAYEEPEESDGVQEKNLPKKHPDFIRSRELGPRFSEPNSFEHEYGTRWKQLHEMYRQKEDALKAERAAEEDKLEAQMEYAKYEHETEMLRAQLRQREEDRERTKRSWEMAERAAEERREQERAAQLRHEEQLSARMRQQDDDLRRRQQENTLFIQAQRLNTLLDQQEQGLFETQPQQSLGGGYMEQQFQDRRGYDDARSRQQWDGPRHQDDFPNKRRRF